MLDPLNLSESRILVDTDVFSFVWRKDTRAEWFRPYFLHRTLSISFMTVAQLYYGAYKDRWGVQRIEQLQNEIKQYAVLPYDYRICQEWGRIRCERELKGLPIEACDAWIAACARRFNCALATNNGKHFRNIDNLTVVSPGFGSLPNTPSMDSTPI